MRCEIIDDLLVVTPSTATEQWALDVFMRDNYYGKHVIAVVTKDKPTASLDGNDPDAELDEIFGPKP